MANVQTALYFPMFLVISKQYWPWKSYSRTMSVKAVLCDNPLIHCKNIYMYCDWLHSWKMYCLNKSMYVSECSNEWLKLVMHFECSYWQYTSNVQQLLLTSDFIITFKCTNFVTLLGWTYSWNWYCFNIKIG